MVNQPKAVKNIGQVLHSAKNLIGTLKGNQFMKEKRQKNPWIKRKNIVAILLFLFVITGTTIWTIFDSVPKDTIYPDAKIFLYGESHGSALFYEKEFEAWKTCYEEQEMRALFLELPYYTAEFLNLWMKQDNEDILYTFYEDIEGTASHTEDYLDFFRKIKEQCPETIFYGTDVGHQYETTGTRYLQYLQEQDSDNKKGMELTKECILQGQKWYESQADGDIDWSIREEYMISNFEDAYERCGMEKIMGIYGSMHINQQENTIMAGALTRKYGTIVNSYYVINRILYPDNHHLGFSAGGLLFLLMLYIPNILSIRFLPEGYGKMSSQENPVLQFLEKAGEIGLTITAVIFSDFNPRIIVSSNGIQFPAAMMYFLLAFMIMTLYNLYWIHYFRSQRTMKDFYNDYAGFPLAGATLPVLAALLLGAYGRNLYMLAAAVCLGIGHVGIHYNHWKDLSRSGFLKE